MKTTNLRFVWNIGSIAEQFPDMPEQTEETVLWDRQEKKTVVTLHAKYGNAFCLEGSGAGEQPFSALENWLNSASSDALESENIPGSKPEFTVHPKKRKLA